MKHKTKESNDQSYLSWLLEKGILSLCFLFTVFALITGIQKHFPNAVATSSSVGGRNLPIYCVDTPDKKIALTFDAAWGNEDTQNILDILAKYDIKVTFFMTGGWVEKWAYMKCF